MRQNDLLIAYNLYIRLFFILASAFWVLLWLLPGLAVGGVIGDSLVQLLFFVSMAFVPPTLAYIFFFRFVPWFRKRIKTAGTQI